jgi:2-oxoisovalerate dehydrogenase E1 component
MTPKQNIKLTKAEASRGTKRTENVAVNVENGPGLEDLYRVMFAARCIDELGAKLVARGEVFFHVSGSGHEASAVLNSFLRPDDYLHLHYRDKALMLARGIPMSQFFHSLLCNAESHSQGRQMSAHMSDPGRRVLSIVGPVGNNALQAVGVAAVLKSQGKGSIVVCSMGDGTSQQGEVYEAIAEAVRSQLPVLFLIEDNRYSISTSTRRNTFYSRPDGEADEFYGLKLHRLDGRDAVACRVSIGPIIESVRAHCSPAIVILDVERLSDHTNSDDESQYRRQEEIHTASQLGDPVKNLAKYLIRAGVSTTALEKTEKEIKSEVEAALEQALAAGQPISVSDAKRPLPPALTDISLELRKTSGNPKLTMLEAIREVLGHHLASDSHVTLFGEDIEDPKGDVFGITRGLSKLFPDRVKNSALSESTIVGVSIGRALAGDRPVAFIQFADFIPLALNQIISELGSMYWRTAGGWECSVIIMAPCGGYRPGLGPFHSQTLEGILAHIPGIDIFIPSNAADAAALLNTAFRSHRPTVFLYPKVCLNDRERLTAPDVARQLAPVGQARLVRRGQDLTLVTWGSCVPICERAADVFQDKGVSIELLDLCSISPWDRAAVCDSVRRTRRLLVVHEDNITCGFGAEVSASVVENVSGNIIIRRLARPDTFISCNFENQLEILPSFQKVVTALAEMLEFDLSWERHPLFPDAHFQFIDAIGSGPADQSAKVLHWNVQKGDHVIAGQHLAEMEADKAIFDFASPISGTVLEILVPENEIISVGNHLLKISAPSDQTRRMAPSRRDTGPSILHRRVTSSLISQAAPISGVVGVSRPYIAEGSTEITNEELAPSFPGRSAEEVYRLTGIRSRRYASKDENVLTLAVQAARRALEAEKINISDIDAIFCSTSTPMEVTPSLACRIQGALAGTQSSRYIVAYDLFAACSGYIYALSAAHDFLQKRANGKALVITSETMSRVVNPSDFDTAILFGDGASATVVFGNGVLHSSWASLHYPHIGAQFDKENILSVPMPGSGFVTMQGKRVFGKAVRTMIAALQRTCEECNIKVEELDIIVPHQANGRIIEALQSRLKLPPERVVNSLAEHGNTSSSTIPITLSRIAPNILGGSRVALCSFGGGFTHGAAILVVRNKPHNQIFF